MSHAKPPPITPRDPEMRFRRQWVYLFAAIDGCYGLIYMLGGPANAASHQLMKQILPMPVWGFALVVVSGLLFAYRYRLAGIAGTVVWMVFSLANVITVAQGTALSAGGPVLLLGLAAIHSLITYGAATGLSVQARG